MKLHSIFSDFVFTSDVQVPAVFQKQAIDSIDRYIALWDKPIKYEEEKLYYSDFVDYEIFKHESHHTSVSVILSILEKVQREVSKDLQISKVNFLKLHNNDSSIEITSEDESLLTAVHCIQRSINRSGDITLERDYGKKFKKDQLFHSKLSDKFLTKDLRVDLYDKDFIVFPSDLSCKVNPYYGKDELILIVVQFSTIL